MKSRKYLNIKKTNWIGVANQIIAELAQKNNI